MQKELVDLAVEKLDNIEKYFENRTDYNDNFGYLTPITLLQESLDKFTKELEKQVNDGVIKEGSNEWYSAMESISKMQESIFEATLKKYQDIIDNLSRISDTLDNSIELKEARDEPILESDYKKLMDLNDKSIQEKYNKREKLLKQQAIYDVGSAKYDELAKEIADIDDDIYGLLTDIEELKNKIWEVRWQPFFDGQEALKDLIDETDTFRDLLDSDAFVGKNGGLTDEGLANGRYVKIEFKWASDYPFENYTVFYKKHNSDDDWTGIIGDVYSPEPIYSGSVAKKFDELFAEFEYDIKLSVTDTNGYSEIIRRLPPMSFIIDILKGGKGIAFGRPATLENTFEVDFDAKFDKSIVDKFGEEIQNGLAPNINTTTEDPNTTLKQLIVTNKNTPTGQYMYIETRFFDTKSLTANRSQTAYPYSVEGSSYHRFYYGGSWSPWNRITNASELGTKSMTVMFPSGGTDISGANIINCTILSHDSSDGYLKQSGGGIAIGEGVSSVLVSASVFGWCQKIASTGYFWNRISRFRGTAETEICATITPLNASLYASTIFSPILIQVQAGDVLKLKKMNTESVRIRGFGNTYLTVQVAKFK